MRLIMGLSLAIVAPWIVMTDFKVDDLWLTRIMVIVAFTPALGLILLVPVMFFLRLPLGIIAGMREVGEEDRNGGVRR